MGYQRCFLMQDLQETINFYRAQKRQKKRLLLAFSKSHTFNNPFFAQLPNIKALLNSPIAAFTIKDPLLAKLNHL
jgi:hypothetical protein